MFGIVNIYLNINMYNLLLTITVAFILTFLTWCYAQKRKFQSLKDFPGPKPYPIIGNVLEFGFNPCEYLRNLQRILETYKPIAKVWMGPNAVYIVSTDPEFNEFILNSPKCINKAIDYRFTKPFLKNGLIVSNGSYWQKRRKMVTPAFHIKILEDFIHTFHAETNILIERLSKNVGKDVFDVFPYIADCALDIICETAMGTSVNAQSSINNEFANAVDTGIQIIIKRLFSPWKRFEILFRLTNDYRAQQKALKYFFGFTKSVIEQRKKKLLNKTQNEEKADDVDMKKKQVFLDVLLTSTIDGQPLSDADIQEEVNNFMIAGYDTTATLISFTMYELARNPDVQAKLFSELRKIFNDDKNFQASLQDLNNMKYTEFVLKEALRMYPPITFIGRAVEEDINCKGTVIPKDTTLGIFIFGTHRRADLYPNPNTFNPDRFLEKNNISNPFAYIPFSGGPRNCIGQKYAMYEAKCIIAKIIMNFEILPADAKYDVQLAGEIVLKSMNGVHVQLKHREFKN